MKCIVSRMRDPFSVTSITALLGGVEMLKLKRDKESEPVLTERNVPLVHRRLTIALSVVFCDWIQTRPVSVERASVSFACKPELSKIFIPDDFDE